MPQQIRDRLAQPGIRLDFTLAELSLEPVMQLVHYWPTVLLMKPQSLIGGQSTLTCFSVVTVYLAQHVQDIAALVGEVGCHLHELAPSMGKAVGQPGPSDSGAIDQLHKKR